MAVDFSTQVYTPTYNVFSRPITITPTKSQPLHLAYTARGIYGTAPIDVMAEDASIISDQRTILDIMETEFAVLPVQGDLVDIPSSASLPAMGTFEIIDTNTNGGGETTLFLRKWVTASPVPTP
jgi:hypothetical protein